MMTRTAILLLFAIYTASSQFTAEVSSNPVSAGERFQITFTIEGDARNFRPPDFKGFSILSGPSQSQSVQIVNGQMSRQLSFTYLLQAGDPGDYMIQPATVESEGKRLQSNSIKLKVIKGQTTPQQKQQDDPEKSLSRQAEDIISKNVFIELSVSKQNVMQGEQIVATYTLYVSPNLQLVGLKPVKMPVYNGFWAQDLDENRQQLSYTPKVLNGVRYNAAVLKRVVLIPQQSGRLTVEPIELECTARLLVRGQRRQRDFFDSFFDDPFSSGGYRDFPYNSKSKTAQITVTPLPQPSPIDFTGGVGDLKMEAWLDKTQTKTNNPITLKVKITGRGNLKLINNINVNLPPNFESYEPKLVDNISTTSAGMSGSRIFEYMLLPRNHGNFKIEPVKFGYYDLSKRDYVSLSSSEFSVLVEKGEDGDAPAVISGVKKEDVQYLGKDIRYIKTKTSKLSGNGNGYFGSAMFYALNGLPLAMFFLFIFWRRKQIELNRNKTLLRNRKATKIARKRLSAAAKYLKSGSGDKFYEETERALWGYISDKLNIPASELSAENASQSLLAHGVTEEIVSETLNTLEKCEYARYAPDAANYAMDDAYNNAAGVIGKLEGYLK